MTLNDKSANLDAFYSARLGRADGAAKVQPGLAPDYAADDLARLPDGMAGSSFGCGNPLAFAAVRPGDTVLDLGCGAGLDLLLAARRTGPEGRVIGVDSNPDMLARAQANAREAGAAQVELLEGRVEALPLADASVDWVISNCVLNLSQDKPAAFREIRRVLRPGGRVLVSDLVADDLPDWVMQHRDLYAACIAGVVSEARYTALAREAGLDAVAVVDRLAYDAGMLRVLVEQELPVALDCLAATLDMTRAALLDMVAAQLAGRVVSIKLAARRPPA
jgi:SAM-dependent methyltransferase